MQQVQPYLFFGGRCDEALAFYTRALGAEVSARMLFKDSPEPPPPGALAEGWQHKVMHAEMRILGTTVMASDGCSSSPEAEFKGFGLSLAARDAGHAERLFQALADGGQVQMPLGRTFWSPCFGMVTDRFGVLWMVGAAE